MHAAIDIYIYTHAHHARTLLAHICMHTHTNHTVTHICYCMHACTRTYTHTHYILYTVITHRHVHAHTNTSLTTLGIAFPRVSTITGGITAKKRCNTINGCMYQLVTYLLRIGNAIVILDRTDKATPVRATVCVRNNNHLITIQSKAT